EPLGCLGDLGWYCLRFTLWAMQEATPVQVTGRMHADTQQNADAPPVPLAFSGTLTFASGESASFYCSFTAAHAQWAIVSGDKALLQISDFVLPFSGKQTQYALTRSTFALDVCQANMHAGRENVMLDEPSNNAPGSQEANLFQDFSALVLSGQTDPSWAQISLLTQRVLDACLLSSREGSRVVSL
ncbi:MAG: gfo/Idh/MocA family oxidoreductase, partial [Prosthecobacter sp.]